MATYPKEYPVFCAFFLGITAVSGRPERPASVVLVRPNLRSFYQLQTVDFDGAECGVMPTKPQFRIFPTKWQI